MALRTMGAGICACGDLCQRPLLCPVATTPKAVPAPPPLGLVPAAERTAAERSQAVEEEGPPEAERREVTKKSKKRKDRRPRGVAIGSGHADPGVEEAALATKPASLGSSWQGPIRSIRAPRRDPAPGQGAHFGKNKEKAA